MPPTQPCQIPVMTQECVFQADFSIPAQEVKRHGSLLATILGWTSNLLTMANPAVSYKGSKETRLEQRKSYPGKMSGSQSGINGAKPASLLETQPSVKKAAAFIIFIVISGFERSLEFHLFTPNPSNHNLKNKQPVINTYLERSEYYCKHLKINLTSWIMLILGAKINK